MCCEFFKQEQTEDILNPWFGIKTKYICNANGDRRECTCYGDLKKCEYAHKKEEQDKYKRFAKECKKLYNELYDAGFSTTNSTHLVTAAVRSKQIILGDD